MKRSQRRKQQPTAATDTALDRTWRHVDPSPVLRGMFRYAPAGLYPLSPSFLSADVNLNSSINPSGVAFNANACRPRQPWSAAIAFKSGIIRSECDRPAPPVRINPRGRHPPAQRGGRTVLRRHEQRNRILRKSLAAPHPCVVAGGWRSLRCAARGSRRSAGFYGGWRRPRSRSLTEQPRHGPSLLRVQRLGNVAAAIVRQRLSVERPLHLLKAPFFRQQDLLPPANIKATVSSA
ncbi:hypothetical protein SG2310 [Sodalis glossinidius str. 'morsitans']|uniref:Uncharacterized protein n=1 Tax=Sodalis glossinidius (strain morsitans) TaxID=343509 RepID=Q2NQJ0_SODGM|nr:hypothetical protein SG2310 [Sodalis glossinidius str. 'morsitans']